MICQAISPRSFTVVSLDYTFLRIPVPNHSFLKMVQSTSLILALAAFTGLMNASPIKPRADGEGKRGLAFPKQFNGQAGSQWTKYFAGSNKITWMYDWEAVIDGQGPSNLEYVPLLHSNQDWCVSGWVRVYMYEVYLRQTLISYIYSKGSERRKRAKELQRQEHTELQRARSEWVSLSTNIACHDQIPDFDTVVAAPTFLLLPQSRHTRI